ncbi:MAG: universal stress protein [Prochloraceae cyanobacterium]
MFNKILVAVDLSEINKDVFAQALSIAKTNHASLMLLHVLSSEEDSSPLPIPPNMTDFYPGAGNEMTLEMWREQWEVFEREGLNLLQSLAEEAKNASVEVEYQQISGSPGRNICKLARECQADLIVIGRRGRSGLSEMILGSVSNYVLHRAPCSVLIVQS